MRILITGASGFAGRHLSRLLLSKKKDSIYGLVRKGSSHALLRGVRPVHAELLSARSMRTALRRVKPDRVYHLAGQASAGVSWKKPHQTWNVNVNGTRCLLEAARSLERAPKILVACSGEAYGASARPGRKISETDALRPRNPYARSKREQERLSQRYFQEFGLPVIRTRAFNHFGPGQDERFVAASFAKQTAQIALGMRSPEIRVGNLEAVRDFTDVRDVVRAYRLVIEKGKAGDVYNVASGRGRRIAELLRYYLKRSSVRIQVNRERGRLRSSDIRSLVGDPAKLRRGTGWKPRIRFERTLEDTLKDWKERLR